VGVDVATATVSSTTSALPLPRPTSVNCSVVTVLFAVKL
jgi:hypothetical protein